MSMPAMDGPDGTPLRPEEFFTALGLPISAFRRYSPLLRGEVTRTVRGLLPEAAAVAPWLASAVLTQLSTVPALLGEIEPEVAAEHLAAALTTAMYLYTVWCELEESRSGRPSRDHGGSPSPSGELRIVRGTAEKQVTRLLGGYLRSPEDLRALRSRQAQLVTLGVAPTAPRYGAAPGGWLLLAAVYALHDHPVLPRPGRKRPRFPWNRARGAAAGIAFEIGETIALSTAIGLLESAEGA